MKHVPIKEAKEQLESLIDEMRMGERIVLTVDNEPVAEIGPSQRRPRGGVNIEALRAYQREHGITKIVEFIPNDFDDPLPEDFLITQQP